jgi:phenylpropionate dioxygenase-like ring-hydroxylating dioxygenase large terminal subunit
MSTKFLENAWYAATWSDEVGHALFERTIIGKSLVFFRDKHNSALAFDNHCPHRSAPLHRGKLHDNVFECPYHGLRFNFDGVCVYNPHGNQKIPRGAHTRKYPLIEKHAMLWIWMGDPELADPARIPDFSCHTDDRFPTVKGVIEMHGYYELITDNLMDLTHVEFVHAGILGSEAIKRGEHQVLQTGTTIWSNRWCPDGLAPPAWDAVFGNYGKPVDHWLYMRWDAPAHMLLDVGITPTGQAREGGVWIYGTDILTPKDAGSTYYFWGVSASNGNDGPHVGALWTQAIEAAFGGQDKPMIEAQHALIRQRGGNDIEDVDSVFLQSDAGPERCRRELRKLIQAEGRASVPDPRHPDLQRLLAESQRGTRVEPVV